MPKQPPTEEALGLIRAIREEPEKHDLKRELGPFLKHKSNHVIASAARAVQRIETPLLNQELIAAFASLLPVAPKRDQGCKALTAIAEALATQGEDAAEVYLSGIHYIQKEGSYGPPVDTASTLRGICARGLVRMRHPEALFETVNLFADPEIPARVGAARALKDENSREAELLLRLKVLDRDEDEIIAECFNALLSISPERSLTFVARYLEQGSEADVEAAALALGEARLPASFPHLSAAWVSQGSASARRTILLSIAMLRIPEAVEFLLAHLNQDAGTFAVHALEALELYQGDPAVRERTAEIARRRNLRI